jgi:GntR family transcriptional repressor for pyruvate dehydrogenase complex
MFEQLKKDRLYELIVDRIRQSILTGEMRPGHQLPTEPELSEQFGVSRTVVREAIRALRSQGLVEVTPGRGTFITQPPMETITNSLQILFTLEDRSPEELIAARRILEVPLARMAAENIQPAGIATLKNLLSHMRESVDDAEEFIHYDTEFHAELACATQNRVLMLMIEPILAMMRSSREAAMRVHDMAERALTFHDRIFAAMEMGDSEAAGQAMQEHLDQVAEDMERARRFGKRDNKSK